MLLLCEIFAMQISEHGVVTVQTQNYPVGQNPGWGRGRAILYLELCINIILYGQTNLRSGVTNRSLAIRRLIVIVLELFDTKSNRT